MSDRIRHLLTTALVALVAGSLAGVTSAALAQSGEPEPVVQVAGPNADSVDGRHAVGATANTSVRARKLVATNRRGYLPNNIVKPKWSLISGVPAGFADGVDHVGVKQVRLTRVTGPDVTVTADSVGSAYAHCPAGFAVVGGGFYASNTLGFRFAASMPDASASPSYWYVDGRNTSTGPMDIRAYAMCLRVEPTSLFTVTRKGLEPAGRRDR